MDGWMTDGWWDGAGTDDDAPPRPGPAPSPVLAPGQQGAPGGVGASAPGRSPRGAPLHRLRAQRPPCPGVFAARTRAELAPAPTEGAAPATWAREAAPGRGVRGGPGGAGRGLAGTRMRPASPAAEPEVGPGAGSSGRGGAGTDPGRAGGGAGGGERARRPPDGAGAAGFSDGLLGRRQPGDGKEAAVAAVSPLFRSRFRARGERGRGVPGPGSGGGLRAEVGGRGCGQAGGREGPTAVGGSVPGAGGGARGPSGIGWERGPAGRERGSEGLERVGRGPGSEGRESGWGKVRGRRAGGWRGGPRAGGPPQPPPPEAVQSGQRERSTRAPAAGREAPGEERPLRVRGESPERSFRACGLFRCHLVHVAGARRPAGGSREEGTGLPRAGTRPLAISGRNAVFR